MKHIFFNFLLFFNFFHFAIVAQTIKSPVFETIIFPIDSKMPSRQGYLKSVNDSSLTIMSIRNKQISKTMTFQAAGIQKIKILKGRDSGLGFLTGAGFLAGFIIGEATMPPCTSKYLCFRSIGVAITTLGGGFIGTITGLIIGTPTYRTYFILGDQSNYKAQIAKIKQFAYERNWDGLKSGYYTFCEIGCLVKKQK